ncbi:HAD-IIA family hydrolase [Actinophytocola oryzae]|uniref:HAD superfamily hydrolase (TIGR01457 family) n=1 Tax=Actinophytocola oryzae TaxID=502181 RepID=A0A4R7URT7_9PSEU|nr:HAD-IIA family hydrolase [Actinophytocola oryzae]TDV36624.1 HAD superfamily hydrolase (TIGR01457 family) [Actinophytocola oryzae]
MTLLDDYDALLFDLDGTIYRGEEVVPGADRAVEAARAQQVKVRFVTNNASRGPDEVAEHLTRIGIRSTPEEVSTSSQAAAAVLAEKLQPGATVLVVGSDALVHEVELKNLATTRLHDDSVQAVVQGLSKDVGWRDLAEATVAIRGGALWVACNVDPTLPTERGPLPGNGSLVAALRTATGSEPVVAGKPATPLMDEAQRSADAERPLVVGDRMDTDIAGAVNAGLDSLLVFSGVSTPQELLDATEDLRPTYVGLDVAAVTREGVRIDTNRAWADAVREALGRLGLEHEVA